MGTQKLSATVGEVISAGESYVVTVTPTERGATSKVFLCSDPALVAILGQASGKPMELSIDWRDDSDYGRIVHVVSS